jgi:uncharacterized membrane protein YqjE
MFGSSLAKFFKLDNLIENLTGYFETKVELIKVEAKEQVASGLSKAITYMIISFFFSLVLIMLSIGVAIALGNVIGPFGGFAVIATFYLVVGIILFAKRQSINSHFEKVLSENMNKKK